MLIQSFKMALESIWTSKLRSFLTMLGIIIGVFALVVLVSIVHGATSSITDELSGLGTLAVDVSIYDTHGNPGLTMEDMDTIEAMDKVDLVSPSYQVDGILRSGPEQENGNIYGVGPSYYKIKEQELICGRYLMKSDMDNHLNVAVINETILMGVLRIPYAYNALGRTIRLNGVDYEIIGVLKDQELGGFYARDNYEMHIPFTNAVRLPGSSSRGINSFSVTAKDNDMEGAKEEIGAFLEERFGPADETFFISNNQEYLDSLQDITNTLSMVMGGVAAISLLVGGIGIMNIMLVSVTERTREIGIRKAIGATRRTILLQFLLEAMTVSLVGCLAGILLSWAALQVGNMIQTSVRLTLVPSVVVTSIVFSSGIGLIFGLYPANKAARMKPIDALHYTD
ncbi:MAG: ABC transporter permease [Lachnospiraceae bacterium]|nr:ABC transporter permease [Lachnospiraceae bacterium]